VTDLSRTDDKIDEDGDELRTAAEAESSSAESGIEDSRQSEDSNDEAEGAKSKS